MIEKIIEFSAREQVHRHHLRAGGHRRRRLLHPEHPAGRHSGPVRHAGHHLLPLGPKPRHHRGPGHLPDRDGDARRAEGQGHSRLLRLRLLLRLRHLPGRDGHLLGAQPRRWSTSARSRPGFPQGVQTEIGPDATGVGWVYQYALVDKTGQQRPGRAAELPGLVPALLAPERAGRGRGRLGRRFPEAVPGQRQSQRAAGLQHPADEGGRGHPDRATTTWAAGWSSSPAPSTWSGAGAMSSRSRTSRRSSSATT